MKTLFKTQLPSGQVAIASERGLVAAMEAGHDKTRHDDADEIIRRCNAFPELLATLQDTRDWLQTNLRRGRINAGTANRDGDLVSQINAAIAKARGEA